MFKKSTLILCGLILLPPASAGGHRLEKNLLVDEINIQNHLITEWNPTKNNEKRNKRRSDTSNALEKFKAIPELKPFFKKANGYAVFPNVAKVGMGVGGAVGDGEVFQKGKVIGATSLTQLSIGFQLGGQAFSQIIFFKDKKDTNRFIEGNFEFGAQASAVLINEGASIETAYSNGVAVFTIAKGGLMYEASIGGQKFSFDAYD